MLKSLFSHRSQTLLRIPSQICYAKNPTLVPPKRFYHPIQTLTSATFQSHIRHGLWGTLSRSFATPARRTWSGDRLIHPRFFSSNVVSGSALPTLSPPSVGIWLLVSSALAFAVIVVGGVTRLTESGLSITEWKPVTGIIPPMSKEEWEVEFTKYKDTPEFKLLNHRMSLDEFKSIFYMEWGHRVLGRVIGLAFVIPAGYFAISNKLTRRLPLRLAFLATLIGFQGALGWYMVKSGLDEMIMDTPGTVPRVSQYRLAAHLGTAFVLYMGMLGTGFTILNDWKYARTGQWSGLANGGSFAQVLQKASVRRFRLGAAGLTAVVFLTALSGAFVAGLDAGLVYNEFPYMGGRLVPPTDELFSSAYTKDPHGSDFWWRNMLENPTTVQFDHRVLATTSYVATTALFLSSLHPALRQALPPLTQRVIMESFAMVNIQAALGIATLLYLVPVEMAATHQAGSVLLLSLLVRLMLSMRKPGQAAIVWREALARARKPTT